MWSRRILAAIVGLDAGLFVAGGVFAVLLAVSLIPRFAGKTHTAKHIFLYEEMVALGCILGCIFSVFEPYLQIGEWVRHSLPEGSAFYAWQLGVWIFLVVAGFFSGIFVGSMAIAIAEMLDSIPIFSRRIGFRHGLGIMIIVLAIGKLVGSIICFFYKV